MGFFDKVKNALGSKKEDVESQNDVNEEVIEETTPIDKIRNFQYLDDLIHSGIKEIVLDSDIIVSDNEKSRYEEGIGIDADNLVIDGNGHSIDATNKTRIFNIKSKVTIKNLTLKSGHAIDGGAVNIQMEGDVEIVDCQFQENAANEDGGAIINWGNLSVAGTMFRGNSTREVSGGAISIQRDGDVNIVNCQFQENTAKKSGGAINNWGKLSVTETMFMGNSNQEKDGGAISIHEGDVEIADCQFQENTSKDSGGAIINWGNLSVAGTMFMGNSTQDNNGGAINIQEGDVKIDDCQFQDNTAQENGGAIGNFGKLTITETIFKGNSTQDYNGGAIINAGDVDIFGCQFQDNTAQENGGAIANFTKLTITETLFKGNSTHKRSGGAINIQREADVKIVDCQFHENSANKSGGAIINWGKLTITETLFHQNIARNQGSAIENVSGSFLRINDCDFKSNNAHNVACIYNESDDVKIINSIFSNNNSSDNLIFNKNNMDILDCTFESNENMDCIISSTKESRLTISGGKINDNHVKESTIHTEAIECSVSNTVFKNNIILSSDSQCGVDILNEAKLSIQAPKIADDNAILNKGHIDVRKLSHDEAERIIHNAKGASVDEFDPHSEDKFDFTHLNNMIQNGDYEEVIVLNEDISLENYELDFHEGGIDLDKDNLTIDGDNHFIDGKHKTRIFNITGKNITLKNIIFKNGLAMNLYDRHAGGGGAIRIAKNANLTLINCKFIDNASQGDGGAILNNGTLQSENNKFIRNCAEYDAGAIQNNSMLSTTEDVFENNASKTAGAIYNNHKLTIRKQMTLKNNISNLNEDIYNANQVITEGIDLDVEKTIFNTHYMNIDENPDEWQTFQYLNSKLRDSHPALDENIKIEFNDIDDGVILIDNAELDGKGHIIDLNNMNINFKIKNNATIKNLTLKNALVGKDSLFEIEGSLRLENVKFLNNKINNDCHLLNNQGTVEVIDSHFYNNKSKNNSLINNSNNLKITNTDFINNHSNCEGSIINNTMNNKEKVLVENSLFQFNSTTKYGGTIINRDFSVVEISNSKFIKNTAKLNAGAIFNFGKLSLTETMFMGNSTQEVSGGAINIQDGDVEIVDCQFQENTAKEDGGAIFNLGKLSLTETMFMGNSTKEDNGGAINIQRDGDVEIADCQFQENTANKSGGAILNFGKLSVTETMFRGNSTQELDGGAINIQSDGDVDIVGCQFQDNTSNEDGGAILNFGKLSIAETLFRGNSTQEDNGGAINNQRSGIIDALNVEFNRNVANKNGGAIFTVLDENLNLKDCTFKDNEPDDVY